LCRSFDLPLGIQSRAIFSSSFGVAHSSHHSSRISTLLIFVSTTGTSILYAKARIDADVYGQIPGNHKSASRSLGIQQLYDSTKIFAQFCNLIALELNQSHDHSCNSLVLSTSAKETKSGNSFIHKSNLGTTRSTCVCWDIVSETNTLYGSNVSLRGKSLLFNAYQASMRFWNQLISYSCIIYAMWTKTSFHHCTLVISGFFTVYTLFQGLVNKKVGTT